MRLTLGLAIGSAILHIVLFVLLDHKPADGPDAFPQSYVAALSHLLGLIFRTSLCASLALAFTQSLWRLLRLETIEVSSIELLFKIMSDPFVLARPAIMKTAPLLFLLALFTWILPIAVVFPPGALIVVPAQLRHTYEAVVPTYNSSFVGNGSWHDIKRNYLASRAYSGASWGYQ
jgi:hypothetical protein